LIWSAYFAIPVIIIRYITRKQHARFLKIYFLFAAFILACGATHFLDALAFWLPVYRLNALIRFATGVLSWVTVFHLIRIIPVAFSLRSQGDLEKEIEQRKKAEEKFRNLLESAPDAIVIVNDTGIIELINAQTEKMFGYARSEIIGNKIELLMPVRYEHAHQVHRTEFFKNPKLRQMGEGLELFGRRKNNEEFPVEISLSPLETEDGLLISAAIRDISEKKHLEKQIKDININLEKKVQIRTAELEGKNKELEQFAYVASHDLQEPLRTISSFVELLKQQYESKIDEHADKYITFIVQASDRMKILINDLLDYSRIGREKVLILVDSNIILEQVLADLDKSIKEVNASIESEKLPMIECYPTELKLLFQNLISNAIKFRRKDIFLVIKISAQKEAKSWRFAVRDNGIGIENEFNERIFTIFQRLHTRTEYEGSGIGLAHCKKIAELHGGKIWVESIPEVGSDFYFTIAELENNNNGKITSK